MSKFISCYINDPLISFIKRYWIIDCVFFAISSILKKAYFFNYFQSIPQTSTFVGQRNQVIQEVILLLNCTDCSFTDIAEHLINSHAARVLILVIDRRVYYLIIYRHVAWNIKCTMPKILCAHGKKITQPAQLCTFSINTKIEKLFFIG